MEQENKELVFDDARPQDTQNEVIRIENLVKRYGQKKVLDNINFSVKRGEIVGFLGPNGAGKSTTMNILTGYISSTSGRASVDGFDVLENPNEVKRRIGYLPEQPPLYYDMTVREYLIFVYDLKNVKLDKKKHIKEVMEMVKITDVQTRLIKNLSKGYKQRVGLAQALIGNPEVLILDEPTVGLDPKQIIEIRNVIKELGRERTIILSTHILQEVTAVCDKIIIISQGKIVVEDSLEELTKRLEKSGKYMLRIKADQYQIKNALAGIPGLKYLEYMGTREEGTCDFFVECDMETDVREPIFNALAGKGYAILMMRQMEASLEEVFLKVTSTDYMAELQEQENEALAQESEQSGAEEEAQEQLMDGSVQPEETEEQPGGELDDSEQTEGEAEEGLDDEPVQETETEKKEDEE